MTVDGPVIPVNARSSTPMLLRRGRPLGDVIYE